MNRRPRKPLGKVTPVLRVVAVMTLVGAALLMAAAVFGGLSRMGVSLGATPSVLVHHHGPLMVSAFFGAVISMERAVAVRSAWSYLPPVAAVLGGLSLVALSDMRLGSVLFAVAGFALVGVFAHLLSRRWEPFTMAMGLGAVAWAVGNLCWALGVPISEVVPWWAGFLVLTIAGERLELSRFRAATRSRWPFWAGFGITAAGLIISLFAFDIGVRVVGVGFLVLAAWLAKNDVGRSTIRMSGAPRFMAIALFAGYFWLAIAGLLAAIHGGVRAGLIYDAIWHAVFVGFVFSMVFAHAQVILPALSGVRVNHGVRFYVPLVVLHLATALRVAGDLGLAGEWGMLDGLRRAGGIGNAVAIGLFILVLASSVRRSSRRKAA